MIRGWGHGHSIGVGALLGLAAAQHVIVIAAAALLAGVLLGRGWHALGQLAAAIVRRVEPSPPVHLVRPPYNRETELPD